MDPQQMMQALMLMQQSGGMQPQPRALFGGNYQPMIGGGTVRPTQMFDLSGIPGFSGNTPTGQMIGMMMQGILPSLMGPNFTMGQFAPSQNIFDHRYAQQYFMQRRQAIEGASAAEGETYFRMMRGMARMAGIEYQVGGEQEQSARRFGQDIAMMMPTFSSFLPVGMIDDIHGIRGSRMSLAGSVFDAGRYSFDPASGRLGMSGQSATAVSNEIYSTLYGPNANLANMRGLGAGRAGQMYDELMRRGFGPPTFLTDDAARRGLQEELSRPEAEITSPGMRNLRQRFMDQRMRAPGQNLRPEELQADIATLQSSDPQAFDAAMRSFDGARSARMIHQMAGAVSAMRDIFGDMGRPNAPMVELLNGLQAMTQGGLSHMNASQLESSVRQTYALAKYTGMGVEVAQGFAGTANQILQAQGLSPALAPDIAQRMMAYGFAYGRTERPVGIGIPDPEMATQIHGRLLGQAAASPMATRLAAFMQMRERQQMGADGQRNFGERTEARAMADAIAAGATTYRFNGQDRSIFQNQIQMQTVLQDAGISAHSFTLAAVQPPSVMQDTIRQYNLAPLVQANQGQLDSPDIVRTLIGGVSNSLARTGSVPRGNRANVAIALGSAINEEMTRLAAEQPELLSANRRGDMYQAIQQRITNRFRDQPQMLAGLTAEQLQMVVGDARTTLAGFIPRSRFAGYQTPEGWYTIHNQTTRQLADRTMAETRGISQFQQALWAILPCKRLPTRSWTWGWNLPRLSTSRCWWYPECADVYRS